MTETHPFLRKIFHAKYGVPTLLLAYTLQSLAGTCDLKLAEQAFSQSDYDTVLTEVEHCKKANELTPNLALITANTHAHLGNYQQALTFIATTLDLHPDDPEAVFIKAEIFYIQMEYDKAEKTYAQCIALDPLNKTAEFKRFMALLLGRQTAQVEQILRTAFLTHKNPHKYLMHAAVAYATGKRQRGDYLIAASRKLIHPNIYRKLLAPLAQQGWLILKETP